jgi:hypothetical protein
MLPGLYATNLEEQEGGGRPEWMNNRWKRPGPMVEGSYGLSGRGGRLLADVAPGAPSGVEAWTGYSFQAAKKYSRENAGMSLRPYQITWEPAAFFGYRGQKIVDYGEEVDLSDDVGIAEARRQALEGLGQIYGIAAQQVADGEIAGAGVDNAVVMGPTWDGLRRTIDGALSWDPRAPGRDTLPAGRERWFRTPDGGLMRNSPYFTQRDLLAQPILDGSGNEVPDPQARGSLRVVDVLDAFSIHAYIRGAHLPDLQSNTDYLDAAGSLTPSFDDDIVSGIRELRAELTALRAERGRGPLPMYASEFGFMTNLLTSDESPAEARAQWTRDRTQALALVREALILLGEGLRMGMAFQARDQRSGFKAKQFGLYYSLHPSVYAADGNDWKRGDLSPRPAAPAYAAMTSVLEGFRPAPALNEVLDEAFGYPSVTLA